MQKRWRARPDADPADGAPASHGAGHLLATRRAHRALPTTPCMPDASPPTPPDPLPDAPGLASPPSAAHAFEPAPSSGAAPGEAPPARVPGTVRAPDFAPGLDWVQAAGATPTLAALRGRVVVVDLWTYGCINCQHVAPELRALERRFPRGLAVVGVHSGKFIAERVTARLAHAAARLGVAHPVANDRQFRTWRAWAARGWPTLAVVDARGYVVFQQAGERRAAELAPVVERALAAANLDGRRDEMPLPWVAAHAFGAGPADAPADVTALRYPSAVAASAPDAAGARHFAVADAGHHRVLVGRLAPDGRTFRVAHAVGRGVRTRDLCPALDGWTLAPGAALARDAFAACADGPPDQATFDRPQGLAFGPPPGGEVLGTAPAHVLGPDGRGRSPALYVADTGNHAVRAVDVATGAVRTIAGTGARLRTRADRRAGAMASPWGVLAWAGTGGGGTVLLIAMAGTHELWRVDVATGAAGPVAGGRGEALVDGPPPDALLAQPAGLATDGRRIWWADAESSAVREATAGALGMRYEADAGTGLVRTLVGTGLFDFGDVDGAGDAVRLQHPQGLAWVPHAHADGGRLLVADSYNDALKWLDPHTREATTWLGGFAEPGGVCAAGGLAYVADTNAHRVAVIEVRTGLVDTLAVVDARR